MSRGVAACRMKPMARLTRQALAGFPAVERVGVVGQQRQQLLVAVVELQDHRRAEAAQDRRHRLGLQAREAQGLACLRQHVHAAGELAAVGAQQAQGDRDDEGQLVRLAGRGRAALRQGELVDARGGVVAAPPPCTRGVPAWLYQRLNCGSSCASLRLGVGVGDGLREVVAGDGLAVVALEVQRHALGEAFAAHQGLHHAHDLGALFVHGHGVEVVDLQVLVGPHRVRHRAGVLGELRGAQHAHVLDALDGAGRGARRPGPG